MRDYPDTPYNQAFDAIRIRPGVGRSGTGGEQEKRPGFIANPSYRWRGWRDKQPRRNPVTIRREDALPVNCPRPQATGGIGMSGVELEKVVRGWRSALSIPMADLVEYERRAPDRAARRRISRIRVARLQGRLTFDRYARILLGKKWDGQTHFHEPST